MTTGIVLTLCTYAAIMIFLGLSCSRFLILWRASRAITAHAPRSDRTYPSVIPKTAGDVLFLLRLLKVNDLIWFGEWIFHCSFILVLLRHLRYVLNPVPGWVWHVQLPGVIAGYILPLSLIAIFIMKMRTGDRYFPSYNFFLLLIILLLGITGLLMNIFFKNDLVTVKTFIIGVLAFVPAELHNSFLFIIHYLLFLVLMVALPSHVFTAPFVMYEARKREEKLREMLHEK